jgi:hypothetical protein
LEFRALAEPRLFVPGARRARQWFKVGMAITNLGKEPLQFELDDTFEPILRSVGGKGLEAWFEREEECPSEPVTIGPGSRMAILSYAYLIPAESGKVFTLVVADGTGGNFMFDDLIPGRYQLRFDLVNPKPGTNGRSRQEGSAAFWTGQVVTHDVEFLIVAPGNR